MKKVIVSIVSDQTIPNIVFLKNLKNIIDDSDNYKDMIFVFITTEKMKEKRKLDHILNAMNFDRDNYEILEWVILPDDYIEIRNEVAQNTRKLSNKYKDLEWIVNITGGTKLMSLAVYEIFITIKEKASVYYLPMRKDFFYKVFSENASAMRIDVTEYINVEEYLKGYGIEYKIDNILDSYIEKSLKMFEMYKEDKERFKIYANEIRERLRNVKDKKLMKNLKESIKIAEIKDYFPSIDKKTIEFIKEILDKDTISYDDIKFLSGDWLEIYLYNLLKRIVPSKEGDVIPSFSIKNPKNEIDGAVIYKNNLFLFECKTFLPNSGSVSFMNNVIYKSQAIKTTMGLSAEYIVIMLDDNIDNVDEIRKREEAFNRAIKVIWGADELERKVKEELRIKDNVEVDYV